MLPCLLEPFVYPELSFFGHIVSLTPALVLYAVLAGSQKTGRSMGLPASAWTFSACQCLPAFQALSLPAFLSPGPQHPGLLALAVITH